ncbi:MAG: efflux RND transporter periplasmic adaptor subunit, partial [bacterium]
TALAWGQGKTVPEKSQQAGGKKPKPPLVEVAKATTGEITRSLEVTGDVLAVDKVVVAATKEGPISYCPWREGDEVKAGEKLVEIDRPVHRAEVKSAAAALAVANARLADLEAGTRPEEIDQARANVKKWQATLEETQNNYRRQAELAEKDFSSPQALDQARQRLDVAKAELASAEERLRMLEAGPTATDIAVQKALVEEAEAKLQLAKAHLDECTVTAPFDGVITQVHVRPGDLATPRSPLIEMFDPDSLVVRFSVPEAYAASVKPGLAIEAIMDAMPGQTLSGSIARVYPQLDRDTRTRTVEAKLEAQAKLMPYQFARLILHLETIENAVTIPADAILETPDGKQVVFIIEDGKARRRKVEIGIEQQRRVQVTKGLAPGENVVVTGNEMLKNGMQVRSSEF